MANKNKNRRSIELAGKVDTDFNYNYRNSNVDTRSDTTRKGYHEGKMSSAQSNSYHPFIDMYNAIDYYTNTNKPGSSGYNPNLVTGIAPTPGFRKDAFVEAAKKIGILKGARTVSDAGKTAYRGRVMSDREAIKLSGKKYISPYNNPSKGKLYNTGAITANDVFEETSKAKLISNTKTNKVNTAINSTKTSRSVPYLNYANDYIKKNKLSTFMGSNGKMYVKTSDGKVKSVENLEKELRPY